MLGIIEQRLGIDRVKSQYSIPLFGYVFFSWRGSSLGSNNTRCVSGVAEVSVQILNSLLRCFLWVVFKLGDSWDSQVELAGSVVGGGSASLEPIDKGGLQRHEQRFVLLVIDICRKSPAHAGGVIRKAVQVHNEVKTFVLRYERP